MTKEEILSIINPLKEYHPIKNDVSLGYLQEVVKGWEEDFHFERNPDFQRGHVWTRNQQIAFIESMLKTHNTNVKILINRHGLFHTNFNHTFKYSGKYVVIDGLQRLTAMEAFCNGEFKVFDNRISFQDMKENRMVNGLSYNIEFYFFEMSSEKEILNYYLGLNSGGTPHSEEEIQRVQEMLNSL